MKCFLFLVLIAISAQIAEAQLTLPTVGDLKAINKSVIPPSPNASALGKFGEIPVGNYTGIPSISIPVYQWKNNNAALNLNISLNYHAGGIKVDEVASNVGLGWALNAGGVISRTMRGLPDERVHGFLKTDTLPRLRTIGNEFYEPNLMGIPTGNNYMVGYLLTPANTPWWGLLTSLNQNQTDAQQDIFNLSCGGMSCKFYIGKDGSIIQSEKTNLKIIPVSGPEYTPGEGPNPISYFKVIADDGTIYIFDKMETTLGTNHFIAAGSDNTTIENGYTSSWYLSEIQSVNHTDKIKFEYGGSVQNYVGGVSENRTIIADGGIPMIDPTYKMYQEYDHSFSYFQTQVNGIRLQRIRLPDSTQVTFDYETTARQDLNDYALKKVTVSNQSRSHGVKLFHDYYNCDGTGSTMPWASAADAKRLRLYKVQEFGGSESKNPYLLFYNEQTLPNRLSAYQDYWGYPISSSRGATGYIPATALETSAPGFGTINDFLSGTDRTPDSTRAQAGILNKIVYPTLGNTQFVYQCNDAFDVVQGYFNQAKEQNVDIYNTQINQNIPFDLSRAADPRVVLGIHIIELAPRPVADPGSPTPVIPDAIDTTPISLTISNSDSSWSATVYSGIYGHCLSGDTAHVIIPESGTYRLSLHFGSPYPMPFKATVSYAYQEAPGNKLVGGLRIKSLINYTAASNDPVGIKEYTYADSTGRSSGKIAGIPNYGYYKTSKAIWLYPVDGGGNPLPPYYGWRWLFSRNSNSTVTLGSVQGSPVGYTAVTVKDVDPSNLLHSGRALYNYSGTLTLDAETSYPYMPAQYMDWGSGLGIRERYYDEANVLKREVRNAYSVTYDQVNNGSHRSLQLALVTDDNAGTPMNKFFSCKDFYPYSGIAHKTKSVELQYEPTGTIKDSTIYQYDASYYMLKNVKTSGSRNRTMETRLYYPQDYSGISILQEMADNNMVASPVKQEKWEILPSTAINLVDASLLEFKKYGSVIKPYKTNAIQLDQPLSSSLVGSFNNTLLHNTAEVYKTKFAFNDYDEKGNPLTYTVDEYGTGGYQWGYNKQYPVAECKNATAAEFNYEGFEEDAGATVGVAHTGHRYSTTFPTLWSKPNSREYVVSFWYLSGGVWQYSGEMAYLHVLLPAGASGYDDIRVYPKDAQMTTYTYDPELGMTTMTDAKGQTNYYEYDGLQRLVTVRDQDGKVLKHTDYHYADGTATATTCTNCLGPDKKCIGGNCQTGVKVYTISARQPDHTYLCTFHYVWSDSSISPNYMETSFEPCIP